MKETKSELPTAEEMYAMAYKKHSEKNNRIELLYDEAIRATIEFARIHCEAMLLHVAAMAKCNDDIDSDTGDGSFWVDKQSIFDAGNEYIKAKIK